MNLLQDAWQFVLGLLTGVASGLIVQRLIYPAGRGKITAPSKGGKARHSELVKGTFRRHWFKRQIYLFLVLKPAKMARHFPQVHSGPIIPDQAGYWEAMAYIGLPHEAGDSFAISLVAFDSEARKIVDYYEECGRQNNDNFVGLKDLPVGTRVLDTVTVIRD